MNRRQARRIATVDLSVAAREIAESYRNRVDVPDGMPRADRERIADAFDGLASELHGRYHPGVRKPRTTPVDPAQVSLFEEGVA